MFSVMLAQDTQSLAYAVVRGDIHGDVHAVDSRRLGRLAVETDDIAEAPGQPSHDRITDATAGAGDQDDLFF